jgi:hypothetical protein
MAPVLEVAHVWVVVAVWSWVPADLVVVHLVGDQSWDGRWLSTSSDVLTIASATCGTAWMLVLFQGTRQGDNLRVVGIDTRCGDLGGNAGHVVGPAQCRGRTVGTVVVVLIKDGLGVAVRS